MKGLFHCGNLLDYVILFFPEQNSQLPTLFNTRENKELENTHWSHFSPWQDRKDGLMVIFLSQIYMTI